MKIVQVINAMIINSQKITSVLKGGEEYFFLYDGKFKWSISKDSNKQFFLHFYPNTELSLESLSTYQNWTENISFITYSTVDLNTKEAKDSFNELYQIVVEKLFGVDDIFNEIISGI